MKKILKYILLIILILLIAFLIYTILIKKPKLDKDWSVDQKVLPEITFLENGVEIKNMRDITYKTVTDYTVNYYDWVYNYDDLDNLYFMVEPFSDYNWPAHTFVTFGFKNGEHMVISAEVRKKVWESFSAVKWFLNWFELVYMIGKETDFIKLRANYRKDEVFLYPIKIEHEDLKNFFVSVLKRADKLSKEPEFYNTVFNNCTTNIMLHANEIRINDIWFSRKAILPAYADTVVYDLWIIDTELSFDEAKKYYKINELSEMYAEDSDYSAKIRKEIK